MSTHSEEGRISPADWISIAEAARLRNVSRQAISKLAQRGRIRSIRIGGHTLVSRADILKFQPRPAGRPKGRKPRGSD